MEKALILTETAKTFDLGIDIRKQISIHVVKHKWHPTIPNDNGNMSVPGGNVLEWEQSL